MSLTMWRLLELVVIMLIGLLSSTLYCAQDAAEPSVGDQPRIVHMGTVAPNVLCLKIRERKVVWGTQCPYEAAEGDHIDNPEQHRWVLRDGECIGAIAGREGSIIREMDRVVGARVDLAWAARANSYALSSADDANYSDAPHPLAIHRKSKPTALARTAPWQFDSPVEHILYLRLPKPLTIGATYTLSFPGGPFSDRTFTHEPHKWRSDAVHVSHLGFRPGDPAKVAFLSCWMGDGGPLEYPDGLAFSVLDHETGEAVFEGEFSLSKSKDAADEDAYNTNHNGTDVYEADFSSLDRRGTYRVYVAGIGCSYPFPIADEVWRKAFTVAARGFYHQRSGIELGPPYTEYRRPRSFHPDDGVAIYHSTAALMDTGNGLNRADNNFGNLVAGKTDEIVPNAWGGYMDAGDWDRRIQHLKVSRLLLELAEMAPEYFADLSLNIPESDDGLPDVVSEALFNLDGYRRMQRPDGGIRGGIESSEHPAYGDASWQESLDVMAYAPGVWSSYEYAGVAARAAYILGRPNSERAATYLESAVRAMGWAERELPNRTDKNDPHAVHDSRNLAAAELYRATGDERWHRLFIETTVFTDPDAEIFLWEHHEQRDAPWVYATTEQPGVDVHVRENCRRAITKEADSRAAHCDRTAFRWTKYEWRPAGTGILTSPDGLSLARAHYLTGKAKYLRALVLACQTGGGANPVNICYTTGLGQDWPQHPTHVDSQVSGQPPPPGLTVFGPVNPAQMSQDWAHDLIDRTCYPPSRDWPIIEAYFDVFWYPLMCEFTVHSPMAVNAYTWGYLAAGPSAD